MRIYEGSPRQDWEEVLRSIGAWVDREFMREVLLLELDGGFLVQAVATSMGTGGESGTYAKQTYELTDDQIADLIAEAVAHRGTVGPDHADVGVANFYEQALRIIGNWLDSQKPRDVFFFEQGGSFVVRTFSPGGHSATGHQLSEFTRDEIVAMIEAAPQHRGPAASSETET